MPSCGLTIVSHGASPNDPPDAYEGVRCGSFASKGLPSCVPGWCRKTAERTVHDMKNLKDRIRNRLTDRISMMEDDIIDAAIECAIDNIDLEEILRDSMVDAMEERVRNLVDGVVESYVEGVF